MTETRRLTMEIVQLISSNKSKLIGSKMNSFTEVDVDAAVNLAQRFDEMRLDGLTNLSDDLVIGSSWDILLFIMPQKELPTLIQRFLDRVTYSCGESEYVHIRHDFLRKSVDEVADANENGWQLLRKGAIEQLGDEDANAVDRALAVLFVVGNVDDSSAVELLLSHPKEQVQKSARACLFEIRRRPEEA